MPQLSEGWMENGVRVIPWTDPPPPIFDGPITVEHGGWMIIGKPTLRQLLRYWWRNR
jgi:hypothetical protein